MSYWLSLMLNADYKFLYCDIGANGAGSDARISNDMVIWRNNKNEILQGDQVIRTLDPYCIRTLSVLPTPASVLCPPPPYYLRTLCVLPTAYARISVLYAYCLRTLYADSAEICTLIWSAERVRTPWTEYGCRRRQYGERTEPVRTDLIRSIRSIRETWNHFQNWAADRGGSGRKSTDTVRIQYAYNTDPSRIAADRASAAIRSIRA